MNVLCWIPETQVVVFRLVDQIFGVHGSRSMLASMRDVEEHPALTRAGTLSDGLSC